MAMTNTATLPKFIRLQRTLGLPPYAVLGLLETLWQHTHAHGDPVYPLEDIEIICGWDGAEGALVTALLEYRWLDDVADGRAAVHDYWENAPAYVRERESKRAKRREKREREGSVKAPSPPKPLKGSQDCPELSETVGDTSGTVGDTSGTVGDTSGTVGDTSGTVGECPPRIEGEQKGKRKEGNTPPTPPRGEPECDPAFLRFWQAYPRKEGKEAARKVWAKLKPNNTLAEAILEAVRKQSQTPQWRKENGKYIPHASTWLNGRRWEDEAIEAQTCGDGSPVPWEEA